jgi:hypothetical protein
MIRIKSMTDAGWGSGTLRLSAIEGSSLFLCAAPSEAKVGAFASAAVVRKHRQSRKPSRAFQ